MQPVDRRLSSAIVCGKVDEGRKTRWLARWSRLDRQGGPARRAGKVFMSIASKSYCRSDHLLCLKKSLVARTQVEAVLGESAPRRLRPFTYHTTQATSVGAPAWLAAQFLTAPDLYGVRLTQTFDQRYA